MSEASGIEITTLVDNLAEPGLGAEHGFSAWVEVAGRRLLFDTGQGSLLTENADRIGLDLRSVDTMVLSHGHYDHAGGVPAVISRAPTAEICVHPASTQSRYSIRDGVARQIGMPAAARTALELHAVGVRWTTRAEHLAPGLGLTGPIPRLTEYEDTGGPFFVDVGGNEPDPIPDELALWAHTERGLVVVVGCSHAGVVNTVRHALKLSGEHALYAVLGGFHLNGADEHRLARTMEDLLELGPELVVPCHCTGERAVRSLQQTFGERVVQGAAGATFHFGGAREATVGWLAPGER